jgi:nitroreductase
MDMDYENFLKLVKTRRTIRKFKTDPVPDEYVEKIIEAGRWAPSGGNSQPWDFIVIKDKEIKDRIVDIVNEHNEYSHKVELTREEDLRFPTVSSLAREPGYKNAPVFIIFCGDPRTKEAYPLLTMLTRGDSHFASSLASAFLYMALAATTLGLGSQWVSATGHPFVKCLLKELLGIPQKLEIYDMMAVGYPAYQPKPRLVREMTEMVHYGRYDKAKYRSDEEIRGFIVRLRKG